jgi:hypothetical protein
VKRLALLPFLWGLHAGALAAQPVGTAFTYQGRLEEGGAPANGAYDLRFLLFDAATGGAQVGPTVDRPAAAVAGGLFTVGLDFGTAAFTGTKRWLEVRVRRTGAGTYTTLTPRQELTPAPNAVFGATAPWAGVSGKPPGFADDVDNDTLYAAGDGLLLAAQQFAVDSATVARKTGAANQTFDGGTLHLDFAADRVGIGTTSPQAALDVNGHAHVANNLGVDAVLSAREATIIGALSLGGGLTFTNPPTSYLTLPGNAFLEQPSAASSWTRQEQGFGFVNGPVSGGLGNGLSLLFAPVDLPQGALVTALRCYFLDQTPTFDFNATVRLNRTNLTTAVQEVMAEISLPTAPRNAPSIFTAEDTSISAPDIDKASHSYSVFLAFAVTPATAVTSDVRLYGCRLAYAVGRAAY